MLVIISETHEELQNFTIAVIQEETITILIVLQYRHK